MKKKILLLITVIFSALFIGIGSVNAETYLQRDEEYFKPIDEILKKEINVEQYDSIINQLFPKKITKSGTAYSFEKLCRKSDDGTVECPFDGMSEIVFGITAEEREMLLKYNKLDLNYDNLTDEEKEELDDLEDKLDELEDSFIERIKNADVKKLSATGTHIYPSNIKDYKYMIVSIVGDDEDIESHWGDILSYGILYSVNQEEKVTVFKATDVPTDNVANPKTADLNIIYAIAGIGLFMGVIVISSKKMKKLK